VGGWAEVGMGAMVLVEDRPDQPDDGADLLHAPACVVNGFVTFWIADRRQLRGCAIELLQDDAANLVRDTLTGLQSKPHGPPPWSVREPADAQQPRGNQRDDTTGDRSEAADLGLRQQRPCDQ